jgi:hypothetical protein
MYLLYYTVRSDFCSSRETVCPSLKTGSNSPGENMKSRFPLFDIRGSIVVLTLAVATMAYAVVIDSQRHTSMLAASAAGHNSTVTNLFDRRSIRLPAVGLLQASVNTERDDYSPGQVVEISGSGFLAGEQVQLQVQYKPTNSAVPFRSELANLASGHIPWYVTADGAGNIASEWLVEEDSAGQTLLLTADGVSSNLHAEKVFFDAASINLEQCHNLDGTAVDCKKLTSPTNHWGSGNAQAGNAILSEGDNQNFRAIMEAVPVGSYTLDIELDLTKGGKVAYDRYSSPGRIKTATSPTGTTKASATSGALSPEGLGIFPCSDSNNDLSHWCTPQTGVPFLIPAVTAGIVTNAPFDSDMRASKTADGAENMFLYGAGTMTFDSYSFSGDVAGDSSLQLHMHITKTGTTGTLVLAWGGHISKGIDYVTSGHTTATTISGSPYHMRLKAFSALNGDPGNQDMQMAANAIAPPTGTLTIVKNTLGGNAQFPYSVTGAGVGTGTPNMPSSFNLTTVNNNASISWSGVASGTTTVTEGALPAGWAFVSLVCTGDTDNGNVFTGQSVAIDLDSAEGQTCTFTNAKPDAKIVLSPGTATNEVGSPHTITATVSQNDQFPGGAPGDGATGFGPAPDGTLVTFSLPGSPAGVSFVGGNTCNTTGGTGQCTVQINSSNPGVFSIHATTTFSVLGVSLTRATGDGLSGDSVDAQKTYVNMSIAITPNTDTNAVGDPHVFTVTVTKFPAGVTATGGTVNISTNVSPAPSTNGTTCGSVIAFTGDVAMCTITINSATAGTFTANASATATLAGLSVTRDTDPATGAISGPGGSGPGVKKYVDAKIVLSPLTATNNVGQNHVITANVFQDDGIPAGAPGDAATGFGAAPNGTVVQFSLTNSLGATATFVGSSSCAVAAGFCTVTINSPTAGHVVIHATTTFSVGGVSLIRASGDGLSGDSVDAQKDYVSGSLTLVKVVVNDDGGTAMANSFGISTDAGTITFGTGTQNPPNTFTYTSNTLTNLAPGTKSLHENTLAGYAEGTWGCVGAAGAVNSNPQTGSVLIAANENVICTITNNDNTPTLKLVKTVVNNDGGTAVAHDYTLSGTASGNPLTRNFSDFGDSASFHNVNGGSSYALSESPNPGTGYSSSGVWACTGNGTAMPDTSHVIVALGEAVTCTIINTDNGPQLKLVKIVDNNDGGTAVANDFTLSATAGAPNNGRNFSNAGGSGVFQNVFAGSGYVLSESSVTGYTAGTWSCDGGSLVGSTVTVALGAQVTCMIHNTDNTPQLKLVKIVDNDGGGTAVANDFTLSATAGAPNNGRNFSNAGGSGVFQNVFANAGYVLSETTVAGYTAGAWSCTGGTLVGSTVTIALGGQATCTIHNADNPAQLKLVKVVDNNDGGAAVANDFTLFAAAAAPNNTRNFQNAGGSGVFQNVFAGSGYALSESSVTGYTAGTWSCDGGSLVGSTITVALGGQVTCTIHNTDNTPQLKLVKIVDNNDGGSAVANDFTLFAAAGAPNNGRNFSNAGGSGSFQNVFAGSGYALSESSVAGYTAGSWSCDGGSLVGSTVTLTLGTQVTCTIHNTDNPPMLKLVKSVVNNNGGTATAANFNLQANAPAPGNSRNFSSQTLTPVFNSVFADAVYTLSESGPGGYTAGSWSCDGGAQVGATIQVPLGGMVTCTIVNDDIPPQLHLRKIVTNNNGGTAVIADFTLIANGAGANDLSGTSPVDSGSGLIADTWSLSENGPVGYSNNGWVCVGGSQGDSTHISVGIGGSATCTITNDDIPGKLIIRKFTDPSGSPAVFTFSTTGTGYVGPFQISGVTTGGANMNMQMLDIGTYTATEQVTPGWTLTGIGTFGQAGTNCSVSSNGGQGLGTSTGVGDLNTQTVTVNLKLGDTVTCDFENTGSLVTRTQGFWATHSPLSNIAWFGGTAFGHTFPGVALTPGIGDRLLCGREIANLPELLGGFWADIAKDCDGGRRSKIDQARMTLLQQLLAAELNASAFASTPIGGIGKFADWEAAFCGNDLGAINTAKSQAAFFNESGDNGNFTPGTSADAKNAKRMADACFWNSPTGAFVNPLEIKGDSGPMFNKQ